LAGNQTEVSMEKKWLVAEKKSDDVVTQLLLNRGLNGVGQQREFLQPAPPHTLLARSPGSLGVSRPVWEQAVDLIRCAIGKERPLVLHGDYDVDGLCSTALLWETLYFGLGYKNVHPFIPDRFREGYGLSSSSLARICQQWSQGTVKPLLVTVDCGLTAVREVARARELGWDVLVVDHHQCPAVLPLANLIVWSDQVCATGLAWWLSHQLLPEIAPLQLDLVALATLADLQPLLGINRSWVREGLGVLNSRPRLGLQVLLEKAGLAGRQVGTYEVSWVLTPRLNAAGRLQNALEALRLLCTRNLTQAQEIAEQLNRLNAERQRMTVTMVAHARESHLISEQASQGTRKIILVHHETYHEGVIGLVAGRLAQEFHRPALVLAKGDIYAKGSARSVPGFDIIAALRKLSPLFEDLGGHPLAAGFTIKNENVAQLGEALPSLVEGEWGEELSGPSLLIDAQLPLTQVNLELLGLLKKLEPHGVGNPQPLFLSRNVGLVAAQTVGTTGQHLKLRLVDNGKEYTAIWFEEGGRLSSFAPGTAVDIVYTPVEDSWNGNSRLSLQIKDMRLAE
jgi:single-stranded-DNA-specific exonuclease